MPKPRRKKNADTPQETATKMFKHGFSPIWKTLKNRIRPIQQRDLVFENGEGKIGQAPWDKRALQVDKLIYMQIVQWLAETEEIHKIKDSAERGPQEKTIILPFLNMLRTFYCIEGGDDLIPALAYSGFILRSPRTGEKLLERVKQALAQYYGDFFPEDMKKDLSTKGIPEWSGDVQNRMAGEV